MEAHPDDLAVLLSRFPAAGSPRLADAGRVVAFLRICRALEAGLVWPPDKGATRATWIEDLSTLEFRLHPWASHMVGMQQEGVEAHFGMPSAGDLVDEDMERLLGIPRGVAERLAETASRCWRGSGKDGMRKLEFVRDAELRRLAERDLHSLGVAQRTGEVKMCLVLAGSVLEAMLVDLLEQDAVAYREARDRAKTASGRRLSGPAKDLDLIGQIEVAAALGRLRESTRRAAHALRYSRNFVHPTVEREELKGEPLRTQDAALAGALAEMVLADLQDTRSP